VNIKYIFILGMITLAISFLILYVFLNKYIFNRITNQLKELLQKKYNYNIESFTNYRQKRSRSLISLLYEYFS
jgi:F0F1-type ATP synthase membrane subunit b/b'